MSAPRFFSTLASAELDASIVYNGQALLVKRATAGYFAYRAAVGIVGAGGWCGGWAAASSWAAKCATANPNSSAAESFTRSWRWNCNSGKRSLSEMQRKVPAEKANAHAIHHF